MEQDLIDTTTAPIRRSWAARHGLHVPPVDLNRIGAGLVTGTAAGALDRGHWRPPGYAWWPCSAKARPSFSIGGTLGILLMGAF